MLPAAHRLRGDTNFKRLARGGRSFFLPTLQLRAIQIPDAKTRIAFVVSKRISKKAVDRNKLRRRLREIVRLMLPTIRPGFDILVIARPPAKELTYEELHKQLVSLITNARLLQ